MKKVIISTIALSTILFSCVKENVVDPIPQTDKTKLVVPFFTGGYGDTKFDRVTPPTGTPDTIPATFNAGDNLKIAYRLSCRNTTVAFDNINLKIILDTTRISPAGAFTLPPIVPTSPDYYNGIIFDNINFTFSKTGGANYSVVDLSTPSVGQDYILIYNYTIPTALKGKICNLYMDVDKTKIEYAWWSSRFFNNRVFKVRP